ncbi:MAG: response regulator [Deltaproteobacteria bacterium]|nr:response regulator [Deltaproteobacteria bacterium]
MTKQRTAVIGDTSAASGKQVAEALRAEGVEVVATCYDGISLVEAVVQHHPSVVALDLILPRLTGLQVIDALRRKGLNPSFVVASAVSARERVLAAKEAGVSFYILKPIDAARLAKMASALALELEIAVA